MALGVWDVISMKSFSLRIKEEAPGWMPILNYSIIGFLASLWLIFRLQIWGILGPTFELTHHEAKQMEFLCPRLARAIFYSLSQRAPETVSDHSLLLLATKPFQGGPTLFRFENLQSQHKTFFDMISSWWNHNHFHGWAGYRFLQKLHSLSKI